MLIVVILCVKDILQEEDHLYNTICIVKVGTAHLGGCCVAMKDPLQEHIFICTLITIFSHKTWVKDLREGN